MSEPKQKHVQCLLEAAVIRRFINRAAMRRGGSWFTRFFFCRRFVGDQTQTSLGQTSNDATYDVYSSKAVKMLMY